MPTRTVKGREFVIVLDNKRIVVKHVIAKGLRCRVTVPEGALIDCVRKHDAETESSRPNANSVCDSSRNECPD